MEKAKSTEKVCKSVFKSGEDTITRENFTKAWIEMINRLEKRKYIDFQSGNRI